MPLPWKKVRGGKISQLVNDHLHNSQKRRDGSSLVVETGFPTSLIDLFIKNREKLKKNSKRKVINRSLLRGNKILDVERSDDIVEDKKDRFFKGVSEIVALVEASDVVGLDQIKGGSESVNDVVRAKKDGLFEGVNEIVASDVVRAKNNGLFEGVDEIVASNVVFNQMEGSSESVNESVAPVEEKRENGVDVNGVIGVVLKVVLILGLAWGINKLTLGITLSAFLMFFMDYLGKYVDVYLRPCLGDKGVFRILQLVKSNRGIGRVLVRGIKQERYGFSGIGEIQPVESDAGVEEIRLEDEIKEDSVVEGGLGFREAKLKELLLENDEFVCLVGESEGKKSKRDKVKSKMKRCFVKRMRSFRKDEPNLRVSSSSGELVGSQLKKEDVSENGSGRLSVDSSVSADLAPGGFSKVSSEVAIRKAEGIKKLESSVKVWSSLVLGIIVLVGLVRGKIFALMLTLTWCLLLKLSEAPRHRKASGIRSLK